MRNARINLLINYATQKPYKNDRLREIRLAIQRPPLEWLSYCPSLAKRQIAAPVIFVPASSSHSHYPFHMMRL
jgi:hypothetical protein